MNTFLVNYSDETSKMFSAETKELASDIFETELTAEIDYKKVESIDFPLHDWEINAGDDGYFIVNRDVYGLGYFRKRKDGEFRDVDNRMPVFGFKHKNYSQVAIVTGMPYDVRQIVRITDNKYYIFLRFIFNKTIPYENIKIRIQKLAENSGYVEMAKAYRAYQLDNGFVPLKDRLNDELKYAAESPNIRIRMGWKPVPCQILEQDPNNEPPVHTACTFEEVGKLLDSYHDAGIKKAEFCLVGWNIGGHDGRWPQILPVEKAFGGEDELRKLISKAKGYGYAMTCHTNSTDSYSIADIFSFDDVAHTKNAQMSIEAERWGGGRTYNVCPKRSYEIAQQTLPDVADLGFRGGHYVDVITCTAARECHNPKHPVNKKEACEYFDKFFRFVNRLFGSSGSEGPFDHSLKYCDFVLYSTFNDIAIPAKPTEDGELSISLCERKIPFWEIIYHGIKLYNPSAMCVNAMLSKNPAYMLKSIEYGGRPQFYYYSFFVTDENGNASSWMGDTDLHCNTDDERKSGADMVKKTTDIYDELQYLQYEFIENHEEVETNVFVTTYSDGSKVKVDYNTKTFSLEKGNLK